MSLANEYSTTLSSILLEFVSSWVFYYISIHLLYYGLGSVMIFAMRRYNPKAPANRISSAQVKNQIMVSELAFPIYCIVPTIGDFAQKYGLSRVCEDFESCGGYTRSFINFAVYLFLVEAGVFWVHYWLLHVFPWGKRNFRHSIHHSYHTQDEMSIWTGFAFEAIDGASQGMPFVVFQFLIPIPWVLSVMIGTFTGVWTMYIHLGEPRLPWPMLGADYHLIHHVYNWYNFGLFTYFWDWMFGTLRHPWDMSKHSQQADLDCAAKHNEQYGTKYGLDRVEPTTEAAEKSDKSD